MTSKLKKYRNIDRFPIDYAFPPCLRGRLTQGRLPLPWKPLVFDGRGSHPSFRYLYLHSLFLYLHGPSRVPLLRPEECSPTIWRLSARSKTSVCRLAPLHYLRTDARPVSYYALFQGMAASEPTSWLSLHPHFISHLAAFRDLSRWSGLFPFRPRTLSHAVSLPYADSRHSEFD